MSQSSNDLLAVFKFGSMSCLTLIGGCMLTCIFGCAALMLIAVAPSLEDQANDYEAMPTTVNVNVGEEALLSGVLRDNDPINRDSKVGDISEYRLLVYEVKRYDVSNSSETNNSGFWHTERTEALPTIRLQVNGEPVLLESDGSLSFSGNNLSTIRMYSGTARDGDYELVGVREGDAVTVHAIRRANGRFEIILIHTDTREDLIEDTRTASSFARSFGLGVVGFGACISMVLVVVLVAIGLSFRRRTPPAPQMPYSGPLDDLSS